MFLHRGGGAAFGTAAAGGSLTGWRVDCLMGGWIDELVRWWSGELTGRWAGLAGWSLTGWRAGAVWHLGEFGVRVLAGSWVMDGK